MLKVELHTHTDRDPYDRVQHSARELIDHAASRDYQALAITLHDRYAYAAEDERYARDRGIVLIPGVERTIAGRHVLLLNFPPECAAVRTFAALTALKASHPQGLVIAPHAFYPISSALRDELERHADLFDAVEVNAMYTRLVNFNRKAIAWAPRHGKPLVGNSDLHVLDQLGTTFTLVDANADATAICEAIRRGRCEVRSQPLSTLRAAWIFARMLATGFSGKLSPAPDDSRRP